MKIKDMMNPKPVAIGPDTRFHDLFCRYTHMAGSQVHVVDGDDKLLGVIASYHILQRMLPVYLDKQLASLMTDDELVVRKAFERNRDLTAKDVMATEVETLMADDPFVRAKAIMGEMSISAVPVLDEDGRLVGEITCSEVLAYLSTHCLECACDLPPEMHGPTGKGS